MSQPDQPGGADDRRRPLALIVDRDETIRQTLALFVADVGYEPLLARHGLEALELLREHQVAVIITDLKMPVMDGHEFIATLNRGAQAEGKPRPPLIITSAARSQYARYIGSSDVDAVWTSPFDMASLERLLERFLP